MTKARTVPDDVFRVAARTLADFNKRSAGQEKSLFPDLTDVKEISARIALEVAKTVIQLGLADQTLHDKLPERIAHAMWTPQYPTLKRIF